MVWQWQYYCYLINTDDEMQYKNIRPGLQSLKTLDRGFSEAILGLYSLYHTILPLSLKSLNFEQHGNMYITICKIDSQRECAVWLQEPKLGLCNDLEGWDEEGGGKEVSEGEDICIPMADSC